LASVFLFILGLAGVIKAWREKEEKSNYLLAFLAFTPLIIFATVVETRYRFQIYPLLVLSAGYFFAESLNERNQWQRESLFMAVVVVLSNGLADLLLSWDKIGNRFGLFF